MEEDYRIVENETTDFLKSKVIKDYWCFKDFGKFKYTYTVEEVGKRNLLRANEVVQIVRNTACLEIRFLLNCNRCYGYLKFFIRTELSRIKYSSNDNLFCECCYIANVNQSTKKYLSEFKNLSIERKEIVPQRHNNNLSYLEKIFIYTLIENSECLEKGYVSSHALSDFKSLEANGMEYLISNLIDKNYFFRKDYGDEVINVHKSIKHIYDYDSKHLPPDLKEEITGVVNLEIANHLYINIPERYSDISSWVVELYNEIIDSKIDFDDIKEIENYINTKRLMESLGLVSYLCSMKKIPVLYDNALELELLRMNNKFNLNYGYSILNYQSKQVMVYLYENLSEDDPSINFKKQHIYRSKISSFLNHLEKKDENPKFSLELPDGWCYSEIELFVSKYVIKNFQTWEKYTPSEILHLWLNSVDIDIN